MTEISDTFLISFMDFESVEYSGSHDIQQHKWTVWPLNAARASNPSPAGQYAVAFFEKVLFDDASNLRLVFDDPISGNFTVPPVCPYSWSIGYLPMTSFHLLIVLFVSVRP
jgi:hypothetical protein